MYFVDFFFKSIYCSMLLIIVVKKRLFVCCFVFCTNTPFGGIVILRITFRALELSFQHSSGAKRPPLLSILQVSQEGDEMRLDHPTD